MYAKEWLSSEAVALMPPEAEGLFIRLLNLSWDNDGLPTDPEAVKDLAGRKYSRVWRTAWPPVRRKFVERDGRLVNLRQEEERDKQAERRKQRQKAAEARWEKDAHASPPHMQTPSGADSPPHSLAFAVASAGTATTPVPNGTEAGPRGTSPQSQEWDSREAAKQLRALCYRPDGKPPEGYDIAEDLRWWKRCRAAGQTDGRILAALHGLPHLVASAHGKWSPARLFSKQGDWVSLFERAVTEDGKHGRPVSLGETIQRLSAPPLKVGA